MDQVRDQYIYLRVFQTFKNSILGICKISTNHHLIVRSLFMTYFIKKTILNKQPCTKNEVSQWGILQSMWPNPQETADLVTLTEEFLNGKLHFLCIARSTKTRIQASVFCVVHVFFIHI